MNHVCSPWRMEYIQSPKEETCVFCDALELPDGPENLVIYRGQQAFVILNRYPYTSGHLMTLPYGHHPSLESLDPLARAEMMELAVRAMHVLQKVYRPQGFNIGVNIGEAAGAGIIEHVHMHIVPRWVGDTNFMSTLGQVRVLPETLEDTCRRVCEEWRCLSNDE